MSEDAFNARFTRLESNIDRITEALVKIAEIDGRQAAIQEMIIQQNKVILKLGEDVSEGLKRAHDRIDALGVRISGADGFVQNATPKITELKQDLKNAHDDILSLQKWRTFIAGGTAVAFVLGGTIISMVLYIQSEHDADFRTKIDRLERYTNANFEAVKSLRSDLDRVKK